MDLSIIIVTYNSSPYIERCLRSLEGPMGKTDHELIVVDNASVDETRPLLKHRFPGVILIENPSNAGFGAANNLGLQRARGEFVLLLNPDTSWRQGDIRKAMQWLRVRPEIGGIGGRLVLEDGSWQKSHGHFPTLGRETEEAFYLPGLFPCGDLGVFVYRESQEERPVDWISATFFLAPKKVLLDVSGFDSRFFMYYEDIDLSRRIREKGKILFYYPDIEITHYQRLGSVIDYGESPYLYFHKYFGLHFAEKLRYILLLKTLLRMGFFLLLSFYSKKPGFREKLRSNYHTFTYHRVEAPKVLRSLKVGSKQ